MHNSETAHYRKKNLHPIIPDPQQPTAVIMKLAKSQGIGMHYIIVCFTYVSSSF